VGWYHSHPHFEAQPSIIDIKNQVLQQQQARDGGAEPYIGAIVGPYDEGLPGNASHLTWFRVQHEVGRLPGPDQDPLQAGCRPMALQVGFPSLFILCKCMHICDTHVCLIPWGLGFCECMHA
jgi:hypothetical protein